MASMGYRARLPQSVVQVAVRQSPGAGAAIGRGLQQLGQTVLQVSYDTAATREKIADSEARMARGQAVMDGLGRFTELQDRVGQKLQELRDTSTPGAPEHTVRAEEEVRKAADEFLGTLPRDPQVQQYFVPQVQRWKSQSIDSERGWERTTRNKYIGEQFDTWKSAKAAWLVTNGGADDLQTAVQEADTAIDMMPIDGTTKSWLKGEVRKSFVPAVFEGALARGQVDALERVLDGGSFDQWIGGAEGKSRWYERVATFRDIRDREAAKIEQTQRREAEDALDAIDALIDTGQPPSRAEIDTALANAQAAGVEPARLIRFADAGDRAEYRARALGMDNAQLQDEFGRLSRLRAAGKASQRDVRALDAANKELDARAEGKASGLDDLWKGSLPEKAMAVAQLRAMSPADRSRVARKLDSNAAVLASLAPRHAEVALRGAEIRDQRPGAFMPRGPREKEGDEKLARQAFNTYLGMALMNDLGPGYEALLNTSLDLFVGYSANAGGSGTWDEGQFRKAINNAFGATARPDGTLQGGLATIGKRQVILPEKWTAAEFERGLSRLDFAGAAYADSSPARKADVQANYRPALARVDDDGVVWYRFVDANGRALIDASNPRRDWLLRVAPDPRAR